MRVINEIYDKLALKIPQKTILKKIITFKINLLQKNIKNFIV